MPGRLYGRPGVCFETAVGARPACREMAVPINSIQSMMEQAKSLTMNRWLRSRWGLLRVNQEASMSHSGWGYTWSNEELLPLHWNSAGIKSSATSRLIKAVLWASENEFLVARIRTDSPRFSTRMWVSEFGK